MNFWKGEHNAKKIVNMQGLFVLTVGYVRRYDHIITNKVLLYY